MVKRIVILSFFVAMAAMVLAQPKSGHFNTAVATSADASFRLPAPIADASFFGGQLHLVSGGMLLSTPASSVKLQPPVVDTSLVAIDPEITYSVFDPISKQIYYTKKDSKGRSQLYAYYEKKPGKFTVRRVKIPGLTSSVEHPVFSSDGRVMVFVSDSPLGFGGTDLWFSMRNGEKWLSPQNMGHIVNSGGDEVMPFIYGDYLVFSSNGRTDSYGGFDLYATRLVSLKQGDTVSMYPIGRAPVHSLQAPFCSANDDLALIVDSGLTSGWWFSRGSDSSEVLHLFNGSLECVNMRGTISSSLYDEVKGAYAIVAYIQRPGSPLHYDTVHALPDGKFSLFLRPGVNYELSFHAADHFVTRQQLVPKRPDEGRLYAAVENNVRLTSIALDSLLSFHNLFSSSVSSELSPSGRAFVNELARFLVENPGLSISVYSNYNLSADIPFCSLLNGSRLRSLKDYLVAKGVSEKKISISSNRPVASKRQIQVPDDRDLSPVAQSSLTVAFVVSKQ